MDEFSYKNAVKYLPKFFDNQLELDKSGAGLFQTLKKVVEFDQAYIFFLNPDSIQLRYAFNNCLDLSIEDTIFIPEKIKKELFSEESLILSENSSLLNLLNAKIGKSFVLSKLSIRNTVYGFALLCKMEKSYYTPKDIDILEAASAVIAYNIKDVELSNVFRIQLKALKDGIVETNSAYKTIREQNLKIMESDRIKNEFLANISHELRTPLNAIIGFSEVLSEKLFGELNPKQTEYVEDIHVSGIHLLGMINEILDLSKIEAHAMTLNCSSFLISRAVDEVVNVTRPLAHKKLITVEKNVKDGEVYADFQKISQILYNLLSNAIKFSHESGKIEVNVEVSPKKLRMEIKDYGIGIDEKYHGKIFAKFVQLESAYIKKESSTGLGLTITKELVEMHKGKISVKSEVGKGTTFIVEIPILKENDG